MRKTDAAHLLITERDALRQELAKYKPLVEALRYAREGLRTYSRAIPGDRALSLAMQIDRALAPFDKKGGTQ